MKEKHVNAATGGNKSMILSDDGAANLCKNEYIKTLQVEQEELKAKVILPEVYPITITIGKKKKKTSTGQ